MKKFTVLVLLLLMIGSTSLAFAWWDSTSGSFNDGEFELGVGLRLELENTTAGQGLLVPSGTHSSSQSGHTTSYDFSYVLSLEENLGSGFSLITTLSNVTVGGDDYDGALGVHGALTFELFIDGVSQGFMTPDILISTANALSNTDSTDVELRITLLDQGTSSFANDAEALAAYNALKGRIIEFDITFEVE